MANELHAQWGQGLKRARRERGVSLSAITAKTGLHKSHYCRIEAGEVTPTDDVRIRIAAALGARVETLFPYPETEPECPPVSSAQDEAPSPQPETLPTTPRARTRRASRRPAPPARAAAPSATEAAPPGTEAAS